MANTANGVFVFGVDDKFRTVVGIPEEKLDSVETWIRGICNDLITPQLFCRIRKIPVVCGDGVERVIIRVDVPKSLFVHQSPGGYFHRIGSSKRQIDAGLAVEIGIDYGDMQKAAIDAAFLLFLVSFCMQW